MRPERWERITAIFHAALAHDSADRQAFVAASCGDDDGLRREVRSMLAAHDAAGQFGDTPGLGGIRAFSESETTVALAPGEIFDGRYRIANLIGRGGMGEVYRAHDTKLDRDVAIKILPAEFTADPERRARFGREARVLATLNHPHIGAIYGLEEADSVTALVLELVDGLTLADRIAHGPIPLDEALPIARQVAEAVEAAHEQGIVHRDLKPANIKVRPDGTVKVLDFGLAKALDPGHATFDASQSPSVSSPAMTRMGVILGTAAYMSPEQARGKPVDKRSDIWAFGCVLFEMLTGERTFQGEDVSDTMANVLKREPRWDRLPGTTPPAVRLLLRRCLRKEKRQRLQDAAGVRIEIEDALSAPVGTESEPSQNGGALLWRWLLVAGAASLGSALIAAVAVWNLKPSPLATPQAVARLTVAVPADEELLGTYPGIAVSPDGAHLVYIARRRGVQQVFLRAIDRLENKPLVGTEGASAPFFSTDSQWVGFFAQGKLKKIPVSGGAAQIVCDARDALGGSWAPNEIIYFAPGNFSGLWRVSANGGTPQPFTKLEPHEIGHAWPQVLPGGQAVLFTSRTGPGTDEWQVHVQRVSTGERRMLVQGETGYYVPTGHLVYIQRPTGTLVATPFDLTRLELGAAAPVAVADGILSGASGAHYSVSGTGMLAYVAGRTDFDDRTLVWVDRNGKVDRVEAPGRAYETPRVSPGGQQLAFMTPGPKIGVWVYNLARGDAAKLISEGSDQFPVWTRDGKRVSYRATRAGTRNVFWRTADGSGTEEQLTTGKGTHAPGSWSPKGDVLLFTDATEGLDILSLNLVDRRTQPFLRTPDLEGAPQFSPDGRWVAYVSNESGQEEVYVRPYPGPGPKWSISTDGGTEPVWNPNGRELFYRNGNKMMVVDTVTQPVFSPSKPRLLFTGDYVPALTMNPNYDVFRDGRRFLMVQPSAREHATPNQIIVVLNWTEELKQRVSTR